MATFFYTKHNVLAAASFWHREPERPFESEDRLQPYSCEHTEVSACSPDTFWVMSWSLVGFEDVQTHGGL